MDSSKNAADSELETNKKRIKVDNSACEDAENDLRVVNRLCEDELSMIFSSNWITTEDLLNFRLVNKIWRDAATTTLLRRDACYVDLDWNCHQFDYCFDQYQLVNGGEQSWSKLSELTDLISNSPKFPASNYLVYIKSDSFTLNNSHPDLFKFFQVHGDKIKTLHPYGGITQKCLLDILLIHAPNLEYLDLSATIVMPVKKKDQDKANDKMWTSNLLPFKTLCFGYSWKDDHYPDLDDDDSETSDSDSDDNDQYGDITKTDSDSDSDLDYSNAIDRELIHRLLSSPSKLSRIENVGLETLGSVLSDGKGHLVTSFIYNFSYSFRHANISSLLLKEFLALNPKLSSVTLDMDRKFEDVRTTRDVTLVNEFIHSFKDALQDFTILFNYTALGWDEKLKIPPMKNLKSITVCGGEDEYEMYEDQDIGIFDLGENFVEFEDGIPAGNYFPNLKKVSLQFLGDELVQANLMSFFTFKSNKNSSSYVSNCLPKVDILDISKDAIGSIYWASCSSPGETTLPSKMFPNIRILKISCGYVENLSSSWWGISQTVEFMEIYDLKSYVSDEKISHVHTSLLVDKFFTGFSLELCSTLRTTALPKKNNCTEEVSNLFRVTPSVCDLRNLKELKLKFSAQLSYEFASHVTGDYAFSKMPNTKFIICYASILYSNEDKYEAVEWKNANEELNFSSIKPYVQIIHCKKD